MYPHQYLSPSCVGGGMGERNGRQNPHSKTATTTTSTANTAYLKSLYGLNIVEWEPVQTELPTAFPTNASTVDYKAIVKKYYFP